MSRTEQSKRADRIPIRQSWEICRIWNTNSVDSLIQTENASPQMKDKCIEHDAESNAKKGNDKPTTSDKDTQTPESFTAINKCLTEFQDATAQMTEA